MCFCNEENPIVAQCRIQTRGFKIERFITNKEKNVVKKGVAE